MKTKKTTKQTTESFAGKAVFPIGIISEMLNVHRRTLRIYDDEKILKPYRTPKNRRLYTMEDVEMGRFVQFLTRDIGVNLVGVKVVIEFLKKLGVAPADYISYTKKLASRIEITEDVQEYNRERLSKRGRKVNKKPATTSKTKK